MGPAPADVWFGNPILATRASMGKLVMLTRDHLCRGDVVINSIVLIPVIQQLGLRPSVDAICHEVDRFFALGRPAGKPPVRRTMSNIKRYHLWVQAMCGSVTM